MVGIAMSIDSSGHYLEFLATNAVEEMHKSAIFYLRQEQTLLRTHRAIAVQQAQAGLATAKQIAELISHFDNENHRLDKEISEREKSLNR